MKKGRKKGRQTDRQNTHTHTHTHTGLGYAHTHTRGLQGLEYKTHTSCVESMPLMGLKYGCCIALYKHNIYTYTYISTYLAHGEHASNGVEVRVLHSLFSCQPLLVVIS